jgi:hypothetical protein
MLVVNGILSQNDRFGKARLLNLLGQRQHIAFIERRGTPSKLEFSG